MKTFINTSGLKIIASIMLTGALISSYSSAFVLSYAYYQLMNWAVTGASMLIVWQAHKANQSLPLWIFATVAVVFNPIASIYLSAFAWQVADITVVLLFLISFFAMKEHRN